MRYLDLETLDQFSQVAHLPRPVQLVAMRFGLATVYDAVHDRWIQYWSAALPRWETCGTDLTDLGVTAIIQGDDALDQLWADIQTPGSLVGWNVLDFDLAYLMLHRLRRNPHEEVWRVPFTVIDLFAIIRRVALELTGRERWYRLGVVAEATLKRGKADDGAMASQWLASGDPALVWRAARYGRNDVQLVVDLMRAATTVGLICPPRPERNEQGMLTIRLDARGSVVAATLTD